MIPPLRFEPHDPNVAPSFPPPYGAYAVVVSRIRPDGTLDDIIRVDAPIPDRPLPDIVEGMAYALDAAAERLRTENHHAKT